LYEEIKSSFANVSTGALVIRGLSFGGIDNLWVIEWIETALAKKTSAIVRIKI
jgi:hypothetical protein